MEWKLDFSEGRCQYFASLGNFLVEWKLTSDIFLIAAFLPWKLPSGMETYRSLLRHYEVSFLGNFLVEWKHGDSPRYSTASRYLGNFLVEWKPRGRAYRPLFDIGLGNFLVEWKPYEGAKTDAGGPTLETS